MADGNYRIDIYLNGGSGGKGSSTNITTGVLGGMAISGKGGGSGLGSLLPGFKTQTYGSLLSGIIDARLELNDENMATLRNSGFQPGMAVYDDSMQDMNSIDWALRTMGQVTEDFLNTSASIESRAAAAAIATAKKQKSKDIAATATKYALVRTAAYASNHVGLWTGDNTRQQKINNAMKLGIAGYAIGTGNPALAVIGLGLEAGFHAIDYAYKRSWDSKQENENARRSGLVRYIGRGK